MKQKIKRHKVLMLIIVFFLLVCVFFLCDFYMSNCTLMYTKYAIQSPKIESKVRLVHLTDLHNSEFGTDNMKLINKVKEQNPDLICITGDLLNMSENNTEIALNLILHLTENYPVYISLGNHELAYKYSNIENIIKMFEEAGAVVVEFGYHDIEIKGEKIRIGGLYGYDLPETNEVARENESDFLKEFQNTDNYKLLLTHMPFGWYQAGSLDYWDVDLVLTGHTHGGQVRIPFIGGLYAPDIGWFPGKEEGLYYSENRDRVMVLSRGLGSTEKIPRFNNVPEIVVVDIIPE